MIRFSAGAFALLALMIASASAQASDFPEFCEQNPFLNLTKNQMIELIHQGANPEICTFTGSFFLTREDLRDFTRAGKIQLMMNSNQVSAPDAIELAAHGAEISMLSHLVKPLTYSVDVLEQIAAKGVIRVYLNGSDRFYQGHLARLARAGVELNILSSTLGYSFEELMSAARVQAPKPVKINLYLNSNEYSSEQISALLKAGVKIIP